MCADRPPRGRTRDDLDDATTFEELELIERRESIRDGRWWRLQEQLAEARLWVRLVVTLAGSLVATSVVHHVLSSVL